MNRQSIRHSVAVRLGFWAVLLPVLAGCMNIHKAANRGDLAGVQQYLRKGADVDARDRYGRTPLMYLLSDPEKTRALVEQGADVNARDNRAQTPLMKAAFIGQLEVVRYLVGQGADVNARDERGVTALMRAVRHLDVVTYLAEQGADLNAVDGKGESLLLKAAESGRLSTVKYLLQRSAEVEAGAKKAGGR